MARGGPRGGGRGMGFGGQNKPRHPMFIPHVPFDPVLAEPCFPPVRQQNQEQEEAFQQALVKRNQDLTPGEEESAAVSSLVARAQTVLDALIVAPGSFEACQIEEVRQVGSFKKGTMLSGLSTADVVVVLKTLPTAEAVKALAERVREGMDEKKEAGDAPTSATTTDVGFNLSSSSSSPSATVRVMVTTILPNLRRLEPGTHLQQKAMQAAHAAVRHSRWFEENAQHSSVKMLVRLLRDLRRRFDGLSALTPWMTDLLAHYAILNNPSRQALPLHQAYKRVFQLLSAGFFLPGSAGIADPCEGGAVRVHTSMSLEQQDEVCLTAQTLLRVLSHGGYKQVLGIEENSSNVATEMSVWDGVVVSPLERAYERPKEDESQYSEEKGKEEIEKSGEAMETN